MYFGADINGSVAVPHNSGHTQYGLLQPTSNTRQDALELATCLANKVLQIGLQGDVQRLRDVSAFLDGIQDYHDSPDAGTPGTWLGVPVYDSAQFNDFDWTNKLSELVVSVV